MTNSTNTGLFIPSRHRALLAAKNIESWISTGLPVHVVVGPNDKEDYSIALGLDDVTVDVLPEDDRGIGYARDMSLLMADEYKYEWMIFCDDDIRTPSNLGDLTFSSEKYGIPGMGCYFRIYKHFLGLVEHTGVWPERGGMGLQCFSLNVQDALMVGGFDHRLVNCYEDTDLRLKLLFEGLGPWAIHTGVVGHHTAVRGESGGNESVPGGLRSNERKCAALMVREYPDLCTMGNRRLMTKWKKAYLAAGFRLPLELGGRTDPRDTPS